MADIQHELKVRAPRGRVLEALTEPAAIARWHGASVTGGDSEWRLEYPGGPVFRWEVVAATPDRVAWRCVEGPGDARGTEVSFRLADRADGRTLVEVAHTGWPGTGGNFRKCNTLWAVLLHKLRQTAEASAKA